MICDLPPAITLPDHYQGSRPAIIRSAEETRLSTVTAATHAHRPHSGIAIPFGVFGARILWTPALLSPRAWLDTTLSSITKDGSNQVAQWNDISGNSRHAIQATNARKPIHDAGNNWIAFSATARFLSPNTSPGFLPTGTSNWTFASVFRFPTLPTTNQTAAAVYRQGSNATHQFTDFGIGRFNGPYNRFYFSHYAFESNGSILPSINTDYIAIWSYDSAVGRTLYVNGTLDIANGYVSQNLAAVPSTFSLGADSVSTDVRGETRQKTNIAFAGALGQSDREKVEGYLAHKWSLTSSLPSGHPYKGNPPYI